MTILLKKILHYYDDDNGYAQTRNLTDCLSFDTGNGLDIKNNILTLNLKNTFNRYEEFDSTIGRVPIGEQVSEALNILFEEEDQIKVFLKLSDDASDLEADGWSTTSITEPNADYLIGVYYITDVKLNNDEKKSPLKVICADKTYILFNKIFAKTYLKDIDGLTTPEIVRNVVLLSSLSKNDQDPNAFTITTNLGTSKYDINAQLVSDGGYIQDTRTGKTPTTFPEKSITKVWKPVYEWIKDLSQVDYTNTDAEQDTILSYGRPFIFWVDTDMAFHWIQASDVVNSSYEIVVGINDVISVSLTKTVFDVVNMIIFNCGTDINGHGILHYELNTGADVKGLKMKYMPFLSIAEDMYKDDVDNYTVNADRVDSGEPPKKYPSAYDVKTAWSPTVDITSDANYNDTFRTACKDKGTNRATSMLSGLASARWKGSVELYGAKYTPGTLIYLTDSRFGIYKEKIRIMDVKHTVSKSNWFTNLKLEQDMDALVTR